MPSVVMMDAASAAPGDARDALTDLTSAVGTLDPVSFWTVPAASASSGDLVIAGVTGVFLVAAYDREGVLTVDRGKPRVDGKPIPGLRGVRKDAKRLGSTLTAAQVFADVEPVVCLTRATVGAPRTVLGVRVVGLGDLTKDLTRRPTRIQHARAQRVARALGMQIAGDQRRHFVA
ncbi:MAG TPA: hypothetical protein VIE12_08550 [Actinomycetota bacterium]|jgi:hypothetical protein